MSDLEEIASTIIDVQQLLSSSFDNPVDKMSNAIFVFESFPEITNIKTPYDTTADLTSAYIRRTALGEIAIAATSYPLTSATQARELMESISTIFKSEINWCFDNAHYNSAESLRSLLAAIRKHITTVSIKLPERVTYTFNDNMPSLVLAYQLYSDSNREHELIESTNVECPLFMPTKFEGNSK